MGGFDLDPATVPLDDRRDDGESEAGALDLPVLSGRGAEEPLEELVLLVHGFPESWYSWRNQLDPLADAGYRAVAIDVRGYGRSSAPPG